MAVSDAAPESSRLFLDLTVGPCQIAQVELEWRGDSARSRFVKGRANMPEMVRPFWASLTSLCVRVHACVMRVAGGALRGKVIGDRAMTMRRASPSPRQTS